MKYQVTNTIEKLIFLIKKKQYEPNITTIVTLQQIPSDNGWSIKNTRKYIFFIAVWTFQKYMNIPLAIAISISRYSFEENVRCEDTGF